MFVSSCRDLVTSVTARQKKWSRLRLHVRAPLQPRHVHELHHVEHLRAAVAAVARESSAAAGSQPPPSSSSRRAASSSSRAEAERRGREPLGSPATRSWSRDISRSRDCPRRTPSRRRSSRCLSSSARAPSESSSRPSLPRLTPSGPSPASAAAFFRLSLFVLRISRRAELYARNASLHVCLSPSKSEMGWKLEHLWQKRTSAPPLTTWRAPMCSRHVWYRLQ